MSLTQSGRQLLSIARDLVVRADLAHQAVTAIRAGRLDEVTICSPRTTLTDVIAPFIATWGSDDPTPSVWEALPPAVYASLSRGADLAVATEPPPSGVDGRLIAVLPVWAYVAPTHALASRDTVSVEELVGERLLLLEPAQHARRALDAALAESGLVADGATTAGGRRVVIRLFAGWSVDHHTAATLSVIAARLGEFCRHRYGTPAPDVVAGDGDWPAMTSIDTPREDK